MLYVIHSKFLRIWTTSLLSIKFPLSRHEQKKSAVDNSSPMHMWQCQPFSANSVQISEVKGWFLKTPYSTRFTTRLAGGFKYFWNFHPENWGNDPIWRSYFSNGLVQPPTRRSLSETHGGRWVGGQAKVTLRIRDRIVGIFTKHWRYLRDCQRKNAHIHLAYKSW